MLYSNHYRAFISWCSCLCYPEHVRICFSKPTCCRSQASSSYFTHPAAVGNSHWGLNRSDMTASQLSFNILPCKQGHPTADIPSKPFKTLTFNPLDLLLFSQSSGLSDDSGAMTITPTTAHILSQGHGYCQVSLQPSPGQLETALCAACTPFHS